MRQVMMGIVGCLTVLLGLFGTTQAGSISGAACAAHGATFTVSDFATASQINDGFNCPNVELVINFSLSNNVVAGQPATVGPGPGVAAILKLTAAVITIAPPAGLDPADPVNRVQIVNDSAGSEVTLSASSGNITINGGSIKAHKITKFTCTRQSPPCQFKADNSDLIAATSFDNPIAGGGLFFNIFGPIDIHTTNVHGGDTLEMESVSSSITMICGAGDTACKDPTVGIPPEVIAAACPPDANDPPGTLIHFPCNVTFPDKASLKSVCIGAPGVVCNGGPKEKRFTAGTFINFTGSTITSDEHVTFTCKGINFPGVPNSGDLMASGATLIMDSLVINCKGKVDLSKSRIVMAAHLTVSSGINCPAGAVCIDASGASPDPNTCPLCGIEAKPIRMTTAGGGSGTRKIDVCASTITVPGSGFPTLNGGTSPPYGATVLDTTTDCAPRPATDFQN